jgi:hypothetical protein
MVDASSLWWETYIKEFGFFFFFRMAVAVSSACKLSISMQAVWVAFVLPSCAQHQRHRWEAVSMKSTSKKPHIWGDSLKIDLLLVVGMIRFGGHLDGRSSQGSLTGMRLGLFGRNAPDRGDGIAELNLRYVRSPRLLSSLRGWG